MVNSIVNSNSSYYYARCKGSKSLDVLPRLAALLAVLGGGGGVCRAVPGGDGGGRHRHRQQRAGGHRQHVQPPPHRGRVQTTARGRHQVTGNNGAPIQVELSKEAIKCENFREVSLTVLILLELQYKLTRMC